MINRRKTLSLVSTFIAACVPINSSAQSVSVFVSGQVRSGVGGVPGLVVFLLHPSLGRSAPAFTDLNGVFAWNAIPISPQPFFVEVYWGNSIMHRSQIMITQPTQIPPIWI